MYADPSKIRNRVVKIRFNDEEGQLLDALVAYTGEQTASMVREMVLEQVRKALFGESNYSGIGNGNEVHKPVSFVA